MWPLINALQLGFTLLWTAGCISFAGLVLLVLRRRGLALDLARRLWAPGLLAAAGAKLVVRGGPEAAARLPQQPCLFVANHQSVIDICVLFRGLPRPVRFVAKSELRRIPFLGWYIAAMGMAFVERRAIRGKGMVEAMAGLLRSGSDVIAFPEGTRSRDGAIGEFRRGAFQAAIDTGAPVVPLAILGAGAVLPPGGFRVRPGRIELVIGEPLEAASEETRQQLCERAERAVRALAISSPDG